MINPRILLQVPLFLLGSCTPITPYTSINIYTGDLSSSAPVVATATLPPTNEQTVNTQTCRRLEAAELETYKLPSLPSLANIPDDDKQALVDALLKHIKVLREEIKRLMVQYQCGIEPKK